MCGRYSLATPNPGAVRERFALPAETVVEQRFNIAPGQHALAVTTDREGRRRADTLRWGLVPHWASDPNVAWKMINARAESAAERPAYRDLLDRRRCLILADGFFEWQRLRDGRKQPWWITLPDNELFAFAGLWTSWRPPDREDVEPLRTFTILTTQASAALQDVHDRMPVILPREQEARWLDHDAPAAAVGDLLVPLEATERVAVGPGVGNAANDTADVIVPVEPLTAAAGAEPPPTLF